MRDHGIDNEISVLASIKMSQLQRVEFDSSTSAVQHQSHLKHNPPPDNPAK